MPVQDIDQILTYLSNQFRSALPILFTGAGFSGDAKNVTGAFIPSAGDLRERIWAICFPDAPFDPASKLADLYYAALRRHESAITTLLISAFTVDADSLPAWYELILSMPWARCYTLNIDNLALSASRRFNLPRPPIPISATSLEQRSEPGQPASYTMEVIHLNGTIDDVPHNVTFSPTQYAERLARNEPWYVRLVGDLLSHPVIFIGTTLDEPPLWQHLELRQPRGARTLRELRPRSYLVAPQLDRAKAALLADFNVIWIPMTAGQFTQEILAALREGARQGLESLRARSAGTSTGGRLTEVSELSRSPLRTTEYLLGQEPTWADIQTGRAVPRDSDGALWDIARAAAERDGIRGIVAITGTAGSGKSTALMAVALRLEGTGVRVGWIDEDSELSPSELRRCMRDPHAPPVLAIDDADMFGGELAPLLRDIVQGPAAPLVLIALRTTSIERRLNPGQLGGIPRRDVLMPPLADADIRALLDVLDRENRLGILKGLSRPQQETAFREQAGRQLLVAMIQATSGEKFEEKIVTELAQLEDDERFVYSIVAVASAFRYPLTRGDVLIAFGERSNNALNLLDGLVGKHIISKIWATGDVRARHHVIAEVLRDELVRRGALRLALAGLLLVAASKVWPGMSRSARPRRFLRSLLNHRFLLAALELEGTRNLYGELESILNWDFHYWLQRGSVEVKHGDLRLAENFLNQARSLEPDDPLVRTEHAYMLFRQAIEGRRPTESGELAKEAAESLRDLITHRGFKDEYPYHVLGSQGLAWARRGIRDRNERADYLRGLLDILEDGVSRHATARDLARLRDDVRAEWLGISVAST